MADVYQNLYNPDVLVLPCQPVQRRGIHSAGGGKSDAGHVAARAAPQPGHHIP